MAVGLRQTAALFFVEIITTSILQTKITEDIVELIGIVNRKVDEGHKTLTKYKFTEKRMTRLYENLATVIREYAEQYNGLPTCLGIVAGMNLVAEINYQYRIADTYKDEWGDLEEALQNLYWAFDPEGKETGIINLGIAMSEKFESIIRKM